MVDTNFKITLGEAREALPLSPLLSYASFDFLSRNIHHLPALYQSANIMRNILHTEKQWQILH